VTLISGAKSRRDADAKSWGRLAGYGSLLIATPPAEARVTIIKPLKRNKAPRCRCFIFVADGGSAGHDAVVIVWVLLDYVQSHP
jgi:hypothetical protein